MPTITAIAGKIGSCSINGTTIHVENVTVTITSAELQYGVTSMTADADGNRWMEVIAGLNSAKVSMTIPLDYDGTAADRTLGATTNLRPGLAGAGTLVVNMATNYGFSCAILITEVAPTIDVMGSKPTSLTLNATVNGALTYVNS